MLHLREPVDQNLIVACGSGRVAAADGLEDCRARLAAGDAEVVFGLQPEPGFRRDIEIDAQAERGVGGDGTSAVDDPVNSIRRHVEIPRQAIDADAQRAHEVFEENFAGVNRCQQLGGLPFPINGSQ